jgi:hypothetical protein
MRRTITSWRKDPPHRYVSYLAQVIRHNLLPCIGEFLVRSLLPVLEA